MVKYKLIIIVLLVILHERAEFLWYYVDADSKICLWIGERCFRADSFIAFASTRLQYIIQSVILLMLIPTLKRPLNIFLFANFLYFLEYFLTYNEPIGKIDLFSGFYLPISIATVRTFTLLYLFVEAVRITFYKKV